MSPDMRVAQPTTTVFADIDGARESARVGSALAQVLSQLLEQLASRVPARDIAPTVTRAHLLAERGDVTIVREDAELVANGEHVPPSTVALLLKSLAHHGVRSVFIHRQVAKRDLLQLVALLNGPMQNHGPTFADLWKRMGVWRITVSFESPTAAPAGERGEVDGDVRDLQAQLERAVVADDPRGAFVALNTVLLMERTATASTSVVAPPAFDAMATSSAVRLIARLVTMGEPVRRAGDPLRDLFVRLGERAATALFSQMSAAPTAGERRMMFDAIVACELRSPLFVASLRHPHWYVVRNAAALIGALGMTEADEPLVTTLLHPDARVREEVVQSLGMLQTPLALKALLLALKDSTSEVRVAALQALRGRETAIPAELLVAALDREDREDAQLEIVNAMAGSTDKAAHQALVRFCARALSDGGSQEAVLAALAALAIHRPSAIGTFVKHLERSTDPRVLAQLEAIRARGISTVESD